MTTIFFCRTSTIFLKRTSYDKETFSHFMFACSFDFLQSNQKTTIDFILTLKHETDGTRFIIYILCNCTRNEHVIAVHACGTML